MDITQLLAFSVKNKASDLHLSAGLPPMIRVHVFSCSPSNCRSTASHRQCTVSRCTSWMRAVRSCGTQMRTSVSVSISRILPPLWPVSAITTISLARAASIAAITLLELPLVLMASSTSPGAPSACTCLEKIELKS